MSNEIGDKIAACRIEIQVVTREDRGSQAGRSELDECLKGCFPGRRQTARGEWGLWPRFPLQGLRSRQAGSKGCRLANRNLAVEVAQKRIKIAEGKRAAQELLRQLKVQLSEGKQLLKSLEAHAKSGLPKDVGVPTLNDRLQSPAAPPAPVKCVSLAYANELINELALILHIARALFPSDFADN